MWRTWSPLLSDPKGDFYREVLSIWMVGRLRRFREIGVRMGNSGTGPSFSRTCLRHVRENEGLVPEFPILTLISLFQNSCGIDVIQFGEFLFQVRIALFLDAILVWSCVVGHP